MNFAFGECDENEVDVILTCVHRDNEHTFITFILDLMTKKIIKLIVNVTLINHHRTPSSLVTMLGSAIFSQKINLL